eukprot:scaffold26653_cov153-Skeletonema_menzelii.AAC.10
MLHEISLALKTRLTQKKVTPKVKKRKDCRSSSSSNIKRRVSPTSQLELQPIPLIDNNVPGLPYRSPFANPSTSTVLTCNKSSKPSFSNHSLTTS